MDPSRRHRWLANQRIARNTRNCRIPLPEDLGTFPRQRLLAPEETRTSPELLITSTSASHHRCNIAATRRRLRFFLVHRSKLFATLLDSSSPIVSPSPDSPSHDSQRRISGPFVAFVAQISTRIVSLVAGEHHDCPVDPSSTSRTGCLSFALALVSSFLLVAVVVDHRAKNNRLLARLERSAPSFLSLGRLFFFFIIA